MCGICIAHIQPRKHVLGHADYMVPTRQHEPDHIDHTDHTDHADHTDHIDHIDHTDHTDHTDQGSIYLPCVADLDHTDHQVEIGDVSAVCMFLCGFVCGRFFRCAFMRLCLLCVIFVLMCVFVCVCGLCGCYVCAFVSARLILRGLPNAVRLCAAHKVGRCQWLCAAVVHCRGLPAPCGTSSNLTPPLSLIHI